MSRADEDGCLVILGRTGLSPALSSSSESWTTLRLGIARIEPIYRCSFDANITSRLVDARARGLWLRRQSGFTLMLVPRWLCFVGHSEAPMPRSTILLSHASLRPFRQQSFKLQLYVSPRGNHQPVFPAFTHPVHWSNTNNGVPNPCHCHGQVRPYPLLGRKILIGIQWHGVLEARYTTLLPSCHHSVLSSLLSLRIRWQ